MCYKIKRPIEVLEGAEIKRWLSMRDVLNDVPVRSPKCRVIYGLIIERASLSSITWESCNSRARKIPCSTANTSTSSTEKWDWKSLQKAATVWPLQSLMMTPMQDDSWRSNEDPSTLILKTPGGGGDQLCNWEGLGVQKSEDAASLKSSIKFFAICQT